MPTYNTRYGTVEVGRNHVFIYATHEQTYDWAHRAGASWPLSRLSGNGVESSFDKRNGDLLGLDVRGGGRDIEVMADEFNAWSSDVLAIALMVVSDPDSANAIRRCMRSDSEFMEVK